MLSADAGFSFDQRYLKALVCQIECRLHTCDPAADDERVHVKVIHAPPPVLLLRWHVREFILNEANAFEQIIHLIDFFQEGFDTDRADGCQTQAANVHAAFLHQLISAVDECGSSIRFDFVRAVRAAVHDDDAVNTMLECPYVKFGREHDRRHDRQDIRIGWVIEVTLPSRVRTCVAA